MGAVCQPTLNVSNYEGCAIEGFCGELEPVIGRTVCLMACFDYDNQPACMTKSGCSSLTGSADGKRFGQLVRDCNVGAKPVFRHGGTFDAFELRAYFDKTVDDFPTKGFPHKKKVVQEWRQLAAELGPDDLFVFFYSGHGLQIKDKNGDEDDGLDEVLLFVEPDGSPNMLVDDEIVEILESMNPETRVLLITDCCHSGTACDLSDPRLEGRPIFHIAASRDDEEAIDLNDGAVLTTCLLETVRRACNNEDASETTLTELYNSMVGMYQKRFQADQTFSFSAPQGSDPDTCPWPLMPRRGWRPMPTQFAHHAARRVPVHVPGKKKCAQVKYHIQRGQALHVTQRKVTALGKKLVAGWHAEHCC